MPPSALVCYAFGVCLRSIATISIRPPSLYTLGLDHTHTHTLTSVPQSIQSRYPGSQVAKHTAKVVASTAYLYCCSPSLCHIHLQITGATPPEETAAAAEGTVEEKGEDQPGDSPEVGDDAQASPENETAVQGGKGAGPRVEHLEESVWLVLVFSAQHGSRGFVPGTCFFRHISVCALNTRPFRESENHGGDRQREYCCAHSISCEGRIRTRCRSYCTV